MPAAQPPTTPLPGPAREGLMRAWLKVLADRHPDVTWIPVTDKQVPAPNPEPDDSGTTFDELAESA